MTSLRRLLCGLVRGHDMAFVTNLHGDMVRACGGMRSLWRCRSCGAVRYRPDPRWSDENA